MENLKLKGQRYAAFVLMAIFMVFSLGSFAQQKSLKGRVTDNTGATIPGVSVVVKGTTVGTVTNVDGDYQINVPATAQSLMFSYVGMRTQEVQIGTQTTINVLLESESIGVNEVVVVGYGTRMKEELTGAISTVSNEKMQVSTAPSAMSRIQGQVSGVTVTTGNVPGQEPTIRIRGIGTINDANPLYIIDGVPASPGNNLAPGDIESISILKDAASSAIYGTRGANGVVIITTKHGKENQQPAFTFHVRTGVSQAVNQYDMLNTNEYAQAVWLTYKNQGMTPTSAQYGSGANPVIPDYILPAGGKAGQVDESKYDVIGNPIMKANKVGTNWYDEIYRSGLVQEFDMSAVGGGKNASYALSGNYLDEKGFLKYVDFKRFTFRLNTEAKFNTWFKVGENIQLTYIDQHGNRDNNGEGAPISMAYRMQPIIPVYDIKGNFAGTKAPEMGNPNNPMAQLFRARNNRGEWTRLLGSAFAEITPIKGLVVKTLMGYDWGQWNYKGYNIPNPEASEPNYTNGMNEDASYYLTWNWTNTATYSTTFADIHKLNVVIGTEAIANRNTWFGASRSKYFSETPEYMQLDVGEINKDNYGSASEWSLFSQFGRVNYDLRGKYFVEATVRRDGSSRFSPDKRYGVFPAASVGWLMSEENFMASTKDWMDMLKLRVGWGESGNDRMGNYNYYTTYGSDNYQAAYALDGSNTSAAIGFKPANLGNTNVTWESTQTTNIGIEAAFLKRSLDFSLDVWQRNTSGMLYQEPIPEVMGLASPPNVNVGKMKNTGFDIEVGYHNTAVGGKLKYNITATASHYKNEIMKILSGAPDKIIDGYNTRQILYTRFAKGTEYPEFWGYKLDKSSKNGIFQNAAEVTAAAPYGNTSYNAPGHFHFKDITGVDANGKLTGKPDGKITPDDKTFIGSPHPDLTGGLNIDLAYGSFDLNMFFYGSSGNKIINYVKRWIDYGQFSGGLSHDALYNSWGSPYVAKEKATLPMLDNNSNTQENSEAFIEDGSFLRMKSVKLGYTLPVEILKKAQIKSISVYAQMTNVFTLTKYSGLDPEYDSTGTATGVDQGSWPTPRQIMFGINIGL
jgi:TonB-dependent starch-binding outer membrane protein SusC